MGEKTNKGLKSEEVLRNYFVSMGYYVIRGADFKYKGEVITDVDLWLYHKNSLLSRERINVDIKDKKRAQVAERLLWTKGIQEVLNLDSCIVATTDRRPFVREFGQQYGITVLDGGFLSKLKEREYPNRFTEEEFEKIVQPTSAPKGVQNWYAKLRESKNRLLTELDFVGFISTLNDIKFFLELTVTESKRQIPAFRCLYLSLSYALIILDFIQQRTLFLDENKRKEFFDHGFKYGELGKEGMRRFIDIAAEVTSSPKKAVELELFNSYDNIPTARLSEYFTKHEVLKNLFKNAKELEALAYEKDFTSLKSLDRELISLIYLIADFFDIDRRKLPYN